MRVTKRFILFSIIGGLLVLLTGFISFILSILLFAILNIVLTLLLVIDFSSSPKKEDFTLSRQLDVKMSIASNNIARIIVYNNSIHPIDAYVTDTIPEHFKHNLPSKRKLIPAKGRAIFDYDLYPEKRGEYLFDNIYLRFKGIYGFLEKQYAYSVKEYYKVYPNMKALGEYSINSLSRNMFMQGIKRVRRHVQSGDFNSLREYTKEDPYNTINWAASARRNELIVNTYEPEKNQYIYIMVDSSRLMNSEYNHIKKLDYAINSGFLLADYCIKGGDNIGLMVFDNEVRRFIKSKKNTFDLIASNLYDIESSEYSANYEKAIKHFVKEQGRRSLVFIFTDLFNFDEALRFSDAIKNHMSKHLVYTITIKDPRIYELAKTSEDLDLKTASLKILRDREKIISLFKKKGILNLDIEPDKLSLELVSTYLDIKSAGLL